MLFVYAATKNLIISVNLIPFHNSINSVIISIAKKIAASGTDQDFNLNNEYFILYGWRRGESFQGVLLPHEMTPGANPISSLMTFNPVTASDESAVTPSTTGGVIAPVSQQA